MPREEARTTGRVVVCTKEEETDEGVMAEIERWDGTDGKVFIQFITRELYVNESFNLSETRSMPNGD